VVITVNPTNFQTAASRLLEDKVGLPVLFRAQRVTAWAREIGRLCDKIREACSQTQAYSLGGEGIVEYSQIPHPKRKLRLAARENLEVHGLLEGSGTKMIDANGRTVRIEIKQKPREFGKAPKKDHTGVVKAKAARAIANIGTEGSLANGHGVEEWKDAFSRGEVDGAWLLGRALLYYVKSGTRETLDRIWAAGATASRPTAAVSGDDSIHFVPCYVDTVEDWEYAQYLPRTVVGGREAVVLPVVMDISCCDLSVGDDIFESVKRSFPLHRREEFDNLFQQAKQPCTMGRGRSKLTFKPVGYFMYSGWAFTTPIDSFFNATVVNHIYKKWKITGVGRTIDYIQRRVQHCGASMDVRFCRYYEEADFLKTNPVLNELGAWTATVNLGTVLRTMGQCDGDLPGSGEVYSRGERFNADLVQSMEHAGESLLLESLRRRYPGGSKRGLESWIWQLLTNDSKIQLNLESQVNRYRRAGLCEGSYMEMCELLETCAMGEMVRTHAVDTIMKFDYGYS